MASSDGTLVMGRLTRTREALLSGRPMVALVAVLLTTGGHTMNLREMGVSQGWVPAEVYSLQSAYLASLAVGMLACPAMAQRWSCRRLAEWGLALLIFGALMHVIEAWASLAEFLVGRVLAGLGAGMVIYSTPHLIDRSWRIGLASAFILCPVAGPAIVALATMLYETSDWRYGFLFEGVAAAVGLWALLSMRVSSEPQVPQAPQGSARYLPGFVIATVALIYTLHWGQLQGWLESDDIRAAALLCITAYLVALGLAWPHLNWILVRENAIRLGLFFFGGFCQFFHGYLMNVYGGMIVNLSSWQRVLLILPLPIGMALSLTLLRLRWRSRQLSLGIPGAVAGLLLMAHGLHLCYLYTLEWPYWDVRDAVDLNWFPAPGHWELAPARFFMGLGIGLIMVSMDTKTSPDPERETTVRPYLNILQFFGGAIAAGILINFLIIGHKLHYSYSAERDTIQAEELSQRLTLLTETLQSRGQPEPEHAAKVLLFRFINYEADNLVFASIYSVFFRTTLGLASSLACYWIGTRFRAYRRNRRAALS